MKHIIIRRSSLWLGLLLGNMFCLGVGLIITPRDFFIITFYQTVAFVAVLFQDYSLERAEKKQIEQWKNMVFDESSEQ